MRPLAYYNENDPYAAQWLRNLVAGGLIPDGDVDDRSIADVQPDDVRGYAQCHWFAGLGGWAYAARLAGWPDERPIWTGSCPCQPFSVAGKGRGADDERHLWPDFFRLIRACRPAVVMGEQVAGTAGYGWLDGVCADLAGEGYASRGVDIPACSVDAPHIRSRIYWIAADLEDADLLLPEQPSGDGPRPGRPTSGWARLEPARRGELVSAIALADAENLHEPSNRSFAGSGGARSKSEGLEQLTGRGSICTLADADQSSATQEREQRSGELSGFGGNPKARPCRNGTFWSDAEWLIGADGKQRRAEPGIRLLASGVTARVAKLRALGNAIVPPLAAEVIGAFLASEQARAA